MDIELRDGMNAEVLVFDLPGEHPVRQQLSDRIGAVDAHSRLARQC